MSRTDPAAPALPGLRRLSGLWSALAGLAVLNIGLIAGVIVRSPAASRLGYVPDDAFYYLQLARTHARQGIWSIDGGVSVTSGFHPLLAWILECWWRFLKPSDERFVQFGVLLTSCCSAIATLGLFVLAGRVGRIATRVFTVLIVFSSSYMLNSVSLMEWPLALGLAVSLVLLGGARREGGRGHLLSMAVVGFLGSLARSDFGWLAACFAVTSLQRASERGQRSLPAVRWLAGLAGAMAGLGLLSLLSYLTTGELMQSSARMKAHWAALSGGSFSAPIQLLVDALGPAGLVLIAFALVRGLGSRDTGPEVPRAGAAGALALAGYIALYSRSGSVQPWYSSTLIVPAICACGGLDQWLARRRRPTRWPAWPNALWLPLAVLVATSLWARYPIRTGNAPWPHQANFYEAATMLRVGPLEGRVGSWNSGILAFYSDGGVVNLDGLVNSGIYPYALAHRLPEYMAAVDIRYLLDFSRALREPYRQRRGGYDDPAFLDRLQVVRTYGSRDSYWGLLTLYKVPAPSRQPR